MGITEHAGISDTEKLRLLLQVSRLISSKLELKPLIREVLRQASVVVSADRATLWLYDADSEEIYMFVGEGLDREFRIPLGTGVAGTAAAERRTIVIDNAYRSGLFDPATDKQSGYRTKSLLAVPLESQDGRLLGCFQVINRLDDSSGGGVGVFSTEDVELISSLSSITAVAVENAMLYAEQKRQFDSFIVAMAQTVDAKDATTSDHTRMVTGIAVAIAQNMGLPAVSVERIRIAAILHDFGKIGVPDAVLLKTGPHNEAERQIMRSHVDKTIQILSRIAFRRDLQDIPAIAGMHHEKLDGTGYPFGLKGEEISLEGRIIAVADVFQALTQTRPYKKGKTINESLEILRSEFCHETEGVNGEKTGPHLDINVVSELTELVESLEDPVAHFEECSGWDRMMEM